MHHEIFEFFKPPQMGLELRVAPLGEGANVAAAKTKVTPFHLLPLAFTAHHLLDEQQQPSRLRWQFVERTAQHFFGELVGDADVVERDLDVLHRLAAREARLVWPLVLVQERDGPDERQIFHVVAPRARPAVQERQLAGVRIGNEDRFQKPLRIAMHAEDLFALLPRQQSFDGLRLALFFVDRLRLRAVLVHRQHQATIQKFFIQVDGRRREEEHHRAFDAVLVRDEPPRRGIFSR